MKSFLLIVFLFPAALVFSQSDDPQVTGPEENESASLIQLHTKFDASESPPPDFRRWKAFRDSYPLREHEVYQIAGLEEEFYRARTYRRTTIALLAVSPAVCIAGLYLWGMELFVSETPIIGPVLIAASTITFIIGLTRIGKRWSSYSEISPIVSDYNQALLDDMRSLSRAGS